jgi:phosphosulfolactate synthase (CoM biosynthesis protein A)
MSNSEKASYIRKLADDFTVVSEVGFKAAGPTRQRAITPRRFLDAANPS